MLTSGGYPPSAAISCQVNGHRRAGYIPTFRTRRSRASNLRVVPSSPSPEFAAQPPPENRPQRGTPRPRALLAAAVLVVVEAIALLVLGGYVVLAGILGR